MIYTTSIISTGFIKSKDNQIILERFKENMTVDLYIETNARGPKVKNGIGMYLLECEVHGQPYTKHDFCRYQEVSAIELTLNTLIAALARMDKKSDIHIHVSNDSVYGILSNDWHLQWQKRGWINSRDNPVAHAKEWERIIELLEPHSYTVTNGRHSFTNWMQEQIKNSNKYVQEEIKEDE